MLKIYTDYHRHKMPYSKVSLFKKAEPLPCTTEVRNGENGNYRSNIDRFNDIYIYIYDNREYCKPI